MQIPPPSSEVVHCVKVQLVIVADDPEEIEIPWVVQPL
jgi:hypothetical protein